MKQTRQIKKVIRLRQALEGEIEKLTIDEMEELLEDNFFTLVQLFDGEVCKEYIDIF